MDTPGVEVERDLSVFGYHDRGGHGVVRFDGVRVPDANLIAGEGEGSMIAQARLGPGRIHHCMRAIGMAERALELMIAARRESAPPSVGPGRPGSRPGVDRRVAVMIEQARLLVLQGRWLIDTVGRQARTEIAAIKVVGPAWPSGCSTEPSSSMVLPGSPGTSLWPQM